MNHWNHPPLTSTFAKAMGDGPPRRGTLSPNASECGLVVVGQAVGFGVRRAALKTRAVQTLRVARWRSNVAERLDEIQVLPASRKIFRHE
jgi:hypothetical protein